MQMRSNVQYLNRLRRSLQFFSLSTSSYCAPLPLFYAPYTPINTVRCAMMCHRTRGLLQVIFSLIPFSSSLPTPLHSTPLSPFPLLSPLLPLTRFSMILLSLIAIQDL